MINISWGLVIMLSIAVNLCQADSDFDAIGV